MFKSSLPSMGHQHSTVSQLKETGTDYFTCNSEVHVLVKKDSERLLQFCSFVGLHWRALYMYEIQFLIARRQPCMVESIYTATGLQHETVTSYSISLYTISL